MSEFETARLSLKKLKQSVYQQPYIKVVKIQMEHGITIGSSTITPIGSNSNEILEVKDWVNENKGDFDVDL